MAAPFPFDSNVKQAIYQGWNDEAAMRADWEAHGSQKWNDYQNRINPKPKSAEQVAQDIIDASKAEIEAERKMAEDLFGPSNPFVFDEYLAKESAKQEYVPYYTELLQDYLDKVGVSKDTIQSENKLLDALRTTSKGTAGKENRAYDRAVAEAERGFAGQGMFYSGIKKTALGAGEAEKEYSVANTATDVTNKNRDIFGPGRQFETAVAGGVEQRRGEAMKEYYTPRVQTYQRRFPTGSNMLAGYLPADYLRY